MTGWMLAKIIEMMQSPDDTQSMIGEGLYWLWERPYVGYTMLATYTVLAFVLWLQRLTTPADKDPEQENVWRYQDKMKTWDA